MRQSDALAILTAYGPGFPRDILQRAGILTEDDNRDIIRRECAGFSHALRRLEHWGEATREDGFWAVVED